MPPGKGGSAGCRPELLDKADRLFRAARHAAARRGQQIPGNLVEQHDRVAVLLKRPEHRRRDDVAQHVALAAGLVHLSSHPVPSWLDQMIVASSASATAPHTLNGFISS